MPTAILAAFARMLPRLKAEQNLAGVTVIGVAVGSLNEDEKREILMNWHSLAPKPARRRVASVGEFAAMGIKVVRR